jgi:hypothetical protein
MGVSRATFGRIVADARRRVAEALVEGKLLRIEGGPVDEAADGDGARTSRSVAPPAAGIPRPGRAGLRRRGPGARRAPDGAG